MVRSSCARPTCERRGRAYACLGESNGRSKLSDASVRLLRIFRIKMPSRPSYKELGEIFELNPRQVHRICIGAARREAGGPIEIRRMTISSLEEEEYVDLAPPFDESKFIKCPGCGYKAHPARDNPLLCFGCVAQGVDLADLN